MSIGKARGLTFAAILALSATPAHASDFTGMGTFLAALYGAVMVLVTGGLFGISFLVQEGKARRIIRWTGIALGIVLTIWWVVDPIAEGSALAIVLAILFAAFIVALANRSADDGNGRE